MSAIEPIDKFGTPFSRELPASLFDAAACREIDRRAIAAGTDGYVLMQRASAAAFALLLKRWPQARRVLVLCGAGNNAGDGYVLARFAVDAGLLVEARALVEPTNLSGDARRAFDDFAAAGGEAKPWGAAHAEYGDRFDVAVDGLIGTGLSRQVDGEFAAAIARLNRSGLPVLALDIPSGLAADTGVDLGAVRADATITFIADKIGLHTADAPAVVGELWFAGLDIPTEVANGLQPEALRMSAPKLPSRSPTSHKGSHGHVLVVGGDHGMGGATRLTVEAALRSGSGKVSLVTRDEHIAPVQVASPEAMPAAETMLSQKLAEATVIAVGPGLGTSSWSKKLWYEVLERAAGRPVVADADALNILADNPQQLSENWVLTPHPGEAAKLLGVAIAEVQRDRPAALHKLVEKYNATIVLKGNGTLVGTPGELPQLCPFGNPGMATGGMGDVLTGIIAGLLAQDIDCAVNVGVAAHALAADLAAEQRGERGLLARDVIEYLAPVLN